MTGFLHKNNKDTEITAEKGQSILSILAQLGEEVDAPCGGKATCGKCKMKITGLVSPICTREKELLSKEEIAQGIRLACMTYVEGNFSIFIESSAKMTIQTTGISTTYEFLPILQKYTVSFTKPSLDNPICDKENLLTALKIQHGIDAILPFSLYNAWSQFIQEKDSIGTVFLYQNEVIAFGEKTQYGIAMDIGTTTIALYLCNLTTGAVEETKAIPNPQRKFGADVIARIQYTMEEEQGLQKLQHTLFSALNQAIGQFSIPKEQIPVVILTGNTVMEHIAAGFCAKRIANAPFIAETLFDETMPAKWLGLEIADAGKVYFPPCFASYVGGDIATGLIACGADQRDGFALFIDIGTNGEIGIGNREHLCFCATAAGPAFEGAHIEKGLAGVEGAINKVWLEDGTIHYDVIGNGSPIGICGSGIIDAVAVMLEIGALDETGRICDVDEVDEAYADCIGEEENPCFFINKEHTVYLTGKDIREVQLAKAAVCAGIYTLLKESGKTAADITQVILAGGFGAHMNQHSACKIGLIPSELEEKIVIAGNTAGMGAVALLCSENARERIQTIRQHAHYLELSGNPFFMDAYIDQMMFE